jgi:hypothetical protein
MRLELLVLTVNADGKHVDDLCSRREAWMREMYFRMRMPGVGKLTADAC